MQGKCPYIPLQPHFLETFIDYPPDTPLFVPELEVNSCDKTWTQLALEAYLNEGDAEKYHFWWHCPEDKKWVVAKTLRQHLQDTKIDMNPFWTINRAKNYLAYANKWKDELK